MIEEQGSRGRPAIITLCFISVMMLLTAVSTTMVMSGPGPEGKGQDEHMARVPPDLEAILPDHFESHAGYWSRVHLSDAVLPEEVNAQPGELVVYRAYRNPLGRIVTLVIAYGPPGSDSVRLHRPETCYVSQGFAIDWRARANLNWNNENKKISIPVNRLMTQNSTRHEAVSYWMRAGQGYAKSAAAHQWINLKQGFGQTADGVLVRMSSQGNSDREFDLHLDFMDGFLRAMHEQDRKILIVI